jgi:FMN reductase
MTYRIAVVTAGLREPSSTRLLADRLSDAVTAELRARGEAAEVDLVELRPLARPLADNLVTGFPPPVLDEAIQTVTRADALVAVTPVFTASYSGLFKTFFDVLDKEALAGKPTLIAATAGTARHSLVLDHALRPLFGYLRAVVVPTGVFAATEDFGAAADGGVPDDRLDSRIERAAGELADLLTRRTPRGSANGGTFDDVIPFEELLRRN